VSNLSSVFRVVAYLRRYPHFAVGTMLCALGSTAMVIVFPEVTRLAIDALKEGRGSELRYGFPCLELYCVLAVGAFLLRDGLNGVRIILNNTFEQRVIFDLRCDLYAHIQRLPLRWFDQRATGDVMTRVMEDVNSMERVLIDGVEQGAVALLQIVIVAGMLMRSDVKLALLAMSPVPFLATGALAYTITARGRYRGQRKAASEMNALLHDHLAGIRQIRTFAKEEQEMTRFRAAGEKVRQATLVVMRVWAAYNPSMAFLAGVGTVCVLWRGGVLVQQGLMSLGELTGFLLMTGFLYEPVGRLHQLNQILQAGRAASERVFEILDEPAETDDPAAGTDAVGVGDVEFSGVVFSYGEGRKVLHGIDFKVPAGRTFAFVGETGAGKSTVMNLLVRFYEAESGVIRVGGRDVRSMSRARLRQGIGLVTQESFLFNGSVRDNLRFANPECSDESLWNALECANAKGFVERLPEGLDTLVGERGVKLSVGEKQRIAIARVVLKDPPILILDEATASVDNETERLIQQALERLMEGRTCLVIAHRLSTVRHADRILVMRGGCICEEGTHEVLMGLGGVYAGLWRKADAQLPVAG
jgi:ABC-type multidrug transport system fused ATPase/permease subunit